jgi:hypothetical protein
MTEKPNNEASVATDCYLSAVRLAMPHFSDSCVCGGSKSQPNDDCERCMLIAELDLARSVLLRIAYPARGTTDEAMDIFAASELAATVVDRPE